MTTVLDVFRKEQANSLTRLLVHMKRHRLGLRGVTNSARQAALRAINSNKFPKKEKKEANIIEKHLKSLMPRNRIPPGMNNLAALIANPNIVGGNTTKERGNIATRALNMIGYRQNSKYATYHRPSGKVNINPGGVSAENEYPSNNNENHNRLNNRNLQRIRAAFSKLNTLAPRHARELNSYNIYTKMGVPVPGASHPNARILAQVVANQANFAGAYGRFVRNLTALPEERRMALANNFKAQMNQLAQANPEAYSNKRNFVAARLARGI
jgi:hypothetical protein